MNTKRNLLIIGLVATALIVSGTALAVFKPLTVSSSLSVLPVVSITGRDCTNVLWWNTSYHEIFEKYKSTYTLDDVTVALRDAIIQSMLEQAKAAGEDPNLLLRAIQAVYGAHWESAPWGVPCYAEKAIYKGEAVWIIVVIGGPFALEHIGYSIVSLSILQGGTGIDGSTNPVVVSTGCY